MKNSREPGRQWREAALLKSRSDVRIDECSDRRMQDTKSNLASRLSRSPDASREFLGTQRDPIDELSFDFLSAEERYRTLDKKWESKSRKTAGLIIPSASVSPTGLQINERGYMINVISLWTITDFETAYETTR